eukprot:c18908_g2_i2 orf=228-992(+)
MHSSPSSLASIVPEIAEMNPYGIGNTTKSGSKELFLSISSATVKKISGVRAVDRVETGIPASADFGEPSSQNICSKSSIRGLDVLEQGGNGEYKSCDETVGRTCEPFLSEVIGRESHVKGPFPQFLLAVNRTIAEPPSLPVLMTKEVLTAKVGASQSAKLSRVHFQASRSVSFLQSSTIPTFRNDICKLSVPEAANPDMPGDHKRNFMTLSDGENERLSDSSKQPKILDSSSSGKVCYLIEWPYQKASSSLEIG